MNRDLTLCKRAALPLSYTPMLCGQATATFMKIFRFIPKVFGAGGRNRTSYLVVTKHPLCLLSYTGTGTASPDTIGASRL